jgi:hypothetical protein
MMIVFGLKLKSKLFESTVGIAEPGLFAAVETK